MAMAEPTGEHQGPSHAQEGGIVIRGQNQISHPPRAAGTVDKSSGGPALPEAHNRLELLVSPTIENLETLELLRC